MKRLLRNILITCGAALALLGLAALWLVGIIASLAVPSLAVWALGHFAFGWW